MRVKAFLTAGNENRDISLGGRSRNDRVWAKLNTDNKTESDCSLFVSARVSCEKTFFNIELPEQSDDFCEVHIADNKELRNALKELEIRLASANTLDQAKEIILQVEKETKIPQIVLPGEISLFKALAAVKLLNF